MKSALGLLVHKGCDGDFNDISKTMKFATY